MARDLVSSPPAEFALFLVAINIGAILIAWISRRSLRHPGSHGFYRFFAWQGILCLFALHHPLLWASELLPAPSGLATLLMLSSIALVLAGWLELHRQGMASPNRDDQTLFAFEKTTELVCSGIFRYIRHPMYTSLLLLAWGAFLQRPTLPGTIIVGLTTVALLLTARADEQECLAYFGPAYADYKAKTWAFVPRVY